MGSLRVANWLLLGIFLALVAHLLSGTDLPTVIAETLRLDQCITSRPSEKPVNYVHVVTHPFTTE